MKKTITNNQPKPITLPLMTKRNDLDNTPETNINIDQTETPYNDEIALRAVTELLDVKKLKTISRIKNDQVSNISKLYLFASTFNSGFTKALAEYILQLQISINGLGRKELVQLVQQRSADYSLEKPLTSKDIFR